MQKESIKIMLIKNPLSPIQTLTVGSGISPDPALKKARGLYRR